jgi:hypothetical protein
MKTREQMIREIIINSAGTDDKTIDGEAERLEFLSYEAIRREWERLVDYDN